MYRHMKHCQCSVPPMVRPAMMHPGNAPIQQPSNAPIQQPGVAPIVCPPLCRYTDSYVKREVPYIQPLINVNRQHIVDVPRTYYKEINQTVVVPPTRMPYGYGRR